MNSGRGFETRAIHDGQPPDPSSGAVVTPISLATTFAQESPGKHGGFEYSRTGNPDPNAPWKRRPRRWRTHIRALRSRPVWPPTDAVLPRARAR